MATFKYDAIGRRIEKTVNGATTGFLYDGAQAIAELKGSALDTVYHTGVLIDEMLARYGASGNRTLLTDALMSVIAQAKDDQTVENFYAYSAYGEVAALGPDGGNSLQYTGRENDQTGLHYYRARYYDPVLKRFISEDPIGMSGGSNFYAYAIGNPISYRDPLGLEVTMTCRPVTAAAAIGASGPVHCAVVVWHWEMCGGSWQKVIDAQYSLPGGGTSPTGDPTNPTYQSDRDAFNSNPGPYGSTQNYSVPPPPGMSQSDFDNAVINSGNNYTQGPYGLPGFGPNSNTAANNIISGAGGTPPSVPNAWGQNYSTPSWGTGIPGGVP